jgi:enoyl-CoA hydratase
MDQVRSERTGAVEVLTLNRPKALNALDSATLQALREAVRRVASDPTVRALVVTGEGRAFAAGADIAEMKDHGAAEAEAFSRLGHATFAGLEELVIPTIAAVNGFALGGGCELACACDWIYASTQARFGQPEVNLGLIPGFGGTSRLVRRVGTAWGKELVLTGEPIDAETALRIGLANRVFEPDALVPEALKIGEAIARKGPLAVAAAKRVIQEGQGADLRVGAVAASGDAREGKAAFLERRDPEFQGR